MSKATDVSIRKYPASNLVRVDVKEAKRRDSIWMSYDSYRELAKCIALDINEKDVEHIPMTGSKYG